LLPVVSIVYQSEAVGDLASTFKRNNRRTVVYDLMSTVVDASVIICTHNPRPHYLQRVLEALRKQTLPSDQWELILIDNKSQEPLTPKSFNLLWHPHCRVIREEELGVTWARSRGMQEANTDLIIFVDDDNILVPDYLSQAIRIKREWPMLGVWGSGAIIPEFEVEPAKNLRRFMCDLAIRDVQRAEWSNIISYESARPWGAGQCVRASVAVAYREYVETSKIRIGAKRTRDFSAFFRGEDLEICFVACKIGLGTGIFPELRLTHLIPKERVQEDYLVKLAEGITTSGLLLAYKWEKILPTPPFSGPRGALRVLKQLLVLKGIHRRMYLARLRSRTRAREIIEASDRAVGIR
jgi:glycosyltransferase involved in cell wall biosynthesis